MAVNYSICAATIIYITLFLNSVSSHPLDASEVDYVNWNQQQYEMLPLYMHQRYRRQLTGGVQAGSNGGVHGSLGAAGNLYNNNGHRVDGHGDISKNWGPKGPTTIGGGLDYQGPRGGASVNANHAHRFGTDVGASGNANLWKSNNGNSRLDGTANYNQHFGGPTGRSRPNFGAGLNFNHRF